MPDPQSLLALLATLQKIKDNSSSNTAAEGAAGSADQAGSAGTAGTAGSAGIAGSAGSGGIAGAAGSAGSAGSAGKTSKEDTASQDLSSSDSEQGGLNDTAQHQQELAAELQASLSDSTPAMTAADLTGTLLFMVLQKYQECLPEAVSDSRIDVLSLMPQVCLFLCANLPACFS